MITRVECEKKILDLLQQIENVYREYTTDVGYLNMTVDNTGYRSAFNGHWEGGTNENSPINCTLFRDGTILIGDVCTKPDGNTYNQA